MARTHHHHSAFHLKNRLADPMALDHSQEISAVELLHVSKRRSLESSSNKCTKNDKSALCGKPSETNNVTLPIVLGIVLPLGAALILFLFLHRRHVKKLRREDANDPHKSLDFGMDPSKASAGTKNKKGRTQKTASDPNMEKAVRRDHGMSMDIGSPYLLPPGLHDSRESLHSLSRTIHSGDDRYRPATTFVGNDSASIVSHSDTRKGADDSSSSAGSGLGSPAYVSDNMEQNLLQNAQTMSTSLPPNQHVPVVGGSKALGREASAAEVDPTRKSNLSPGPPTDTRDSYIAYPGSALRKSNNYLGPFIQSGSPSANLTPQTPEQSPKEQSADSVTTRQQISSPKSSPPTNNATSGVVRPPRLQSLHASKEPRHQHNSVDEASHYGEVMRVTPPSPKQPGNGQRNEIGRRPEQESVLPPAGSRIGAMEAPTPAFDVRRLSMGFRPLPPDDPTDNPEQRANRIRSFYKEYFDDSKPGPARIPEEYVEDHDEGYLGGAYGAYYSPATGHGPAVKAPFAEPPTRRAMTPPPRAPPRFQGPARHQAFSVSGGGFTPRGARSFSSASDRFGHPARGSSRPALPPPGPLRILPSPHLIKEDSFGIPIDFAPPTSYKDRQAGRPDSPKGGMRPYSPMLPAHLPLASSFDDLSVMPSPHSLRKSGTFTALDFAPPPRFKNTDNSSDAGSIRSNRSAMSAQQLQSIRAGAYRVSRIPKEVVGTRNEIVDSLKPQWGMRP